MHTQRKVLKKEFFERSALLVARELLGLYLVCRRGRKERAFMIIETEAYISDKDLACHASKGRTPRTEVLFGEAGRFYVYFVYGMHHMLNVVTGKKGHPAAVLIRGVEEASGPGRLTKMLGIRSTLSGKEAAKKNNFWFEDRGTSVRKKDILRTPRIGVDYAGAVWAKKPYRFVLKKKT